MLTARLNTSTAAFATAAFSADYLAAQAAAFAAVPASDDETVLLGWADLVPHRDYLVRYAQRQLRDATQAEDVVHDVFEAVISGRARFAGRSALRSWLTAVLKNKVVI